MRRIGPETVVAITGASGGVGRATARLFAKRGAKIALLARGKDRLEATKNEVEERGGRAIAIPTDVSQFEQVEAAASITEQKFGPIDLWINNAMLSMYSPFMKMTPEEFRHIVNVTFLGVMHGTHCALKRMQPRDAGKIIQVGSALAFRSIPLQSAYCASKHAIQGFTESLHSELIHQKCSVKLSIVNMPALNTTQFVWTKNKMGRKARPAGTIYQPEVAADGILFAAEHDRREITVGYTTVEAIVGEKIAPGMLDHYLARVAWNGSLLPEPADSNQPDNFWQPAPAPRGSHGPFDDLAHRRSPQLWLTKNRMALATVALAGLGLAVGSRLSRSRSGGHWA
ncbi:MAG TPA: SDR family oxidoreductase [Tepidisphaeraceae bacterium]|jgi:short-subunit dehydrogenase|nr:SDR family oxidoreductase [Tepidisphaeraceae bacterium]